MPDFSREAYFLARNAGPVCGIDEAGRGPLAGPVLAAAVIFPDARRIPVGLDDSKRLSAKRRETLFEAILGAGQAGIGEASVDEIDRLNIRKATHLAMARALAALPLAPAFALIDGNDAPDLPCRCETLIGGDGLSVSIAAASIIAKVTRDRLMRALDSIHPGYGWKDNCGYGTNAHMEALRRLGPSVHHRRSFAPVAAAHNM